MYSLAIDYRDDASQSPRDLQAAITWRQSGCERNSDYARRMFTAAASGRERPEHQSEPEEILNMMKSKTFAMRRIARSELLVRV
jgi:hypothetical protein